jgi:hypothetical protein
MITTRAARTTAGGANAAAVIAPRVAADQRSTKPRLRGSSAAHEHPGASEGGGYRRRRDSDLEAQQGQRPIAIHALDNLAHSDTGIVMLRRLLREQLQRIEEGLDPINVMRYPSANKRIPTGAWNTILSPAEAGDCPPAKISEGRRTAGAAAADDPLLAALAVVITPLAR